jgi:AraC family transcriptional regulator of arabinose operon
MNRRLVYSDHLPKRDGSGIIMASHFIEEDNYSVTRAGGMRDWLIMFTLSGQGYVKMGEQQKTLEAGDIAVIKGGTPHQYGTRQGQSWNFVWAHFVPDPQEMKWMQLPESPKGLITLSVDHEQLKKRIYRAFKRVIHDCRQDSAHSNELCINGLNEILLLFSQGISKPMDPRVREVLDLLTTGMKEAQHVDDLARAVGLSSSRLIHLFKSETGLTIVQALNQMRLRQAALLLKHTPRNASEVAWDVGFQNYNHFANSFKSQYGMTPIEFRKSDRL